MLVAAAAVGVATVFAAPFSGEALPLHPGLPPPTPSPSPGGLTSSLLRPVEEPAGRMAANLVLVVTSVFPGGQSRPRVEVGVGVEMLHGHIRQTWV